jgi:hypothetical protein
METHPALARLFTQNGGWNAEILRRLDWKESSLPPYDFQVPLLSLPVALGVFEPLPMAQEYLRADPGLRQKWRERLGPVSAIRVGLVWAGNPEHLLDRLRSIAPERLLSLLQLSGFQFYCLQPGIRTGSALRLIEAGVIDLTMHISDFADTAAFVAELDLVISVDTAVAHLAGAMGRPVWTLLPFVRDWRWGLEGETTPWYPTMRLFRQPAYDDWDSVVQSVAAELEAMGEGELR